MEIEKSSSSKKKKINKSKLLYKFQICDSVPNKKLFMGQCFLIDLNSFAEKNVSHPRSVKKLDKLPAIKLKQKSNLEDSLTLQKSKSQNKKQYNNLKPLNNKYWPKQLNSVDIVLSNLKRDSYGLETEQKNNNAPDSFLKRINELYFPSRSRIKYLTKLFEDKANNELKLVDLKKIKGHSGVDFQKKNGMGDNDNLVEYYKNNRYRKLNNTDEKSNEETINNYRLTKAELEKQLKNFHRLKIKNCKNRVGETLNDLIKLKSKNIDYFENFKKLCDFKFDDDLLFDN